MRRNITGFGLTALASCGLAACSSGSSSSADGTGTLTIGLIDTPVFDVAQICIEITQINIKPDEGPALEYEFPPEGFEGPCAGDQVDLLSLRDPNNPELLIEAEDVPAGRYNWIELEVNAALDGADTSGNYDSYVVGSDGGEHELRVPSSSVRLVSGFTVTAGQHTRFTLDWDARRGLSGVVDPPGQDGYLLRPAFRIIDMTEFATLSGRIEVAHITGNETCAADDGSDLDVGNVVYLFEGTEVALEDMNDTDPLATVDAAQNDAGDYVYETLLSPGGYTVAFTCQGDLEDEDLVFELPDEGPDLDVEHGGTAERNFLELTTS